jgi:4-hydroxy-3-polyprenylbenzoate decarboxylase
MPGVIALRAPPFVPDAQGDDAAVARFCRELTARDAISRFPLVVLCDDSKVCAQSLRDFLWIVFTRSNPACDVHGLSSFVRHKHWGCDGSLVIDARKKPHHAPTLEPDPLVSRRVDLLAQRGGPLHGLID